MRRFPLKKYNKNLHVLRDDIYSYGTLVATMRDPYLIKLPWNVGGKPTSPTTSKHKNYVAKEFGLKIIDKKDYLLICEEQKDWKKINEINKLNDKNN